MTARSEHREITPDLLHRYADFARERVEANGHAAGTERREELEDALGLRVRPTSSSAAPGLALTLIDTSHARSIARCRRAASAHGT